MSNVDLTELPNKAPEYDLRDLLDAGCHFGHQRNKWNPQMDRFIYTQKDGVHIFDLAQTAEQLAKAYNYLYKLGQEGKTVLMLGTKRQAREVVKEVAEEAGMFYITSRWLGGFLTNWEQIGKSLKKMKKIEKNFAEDKYVGYTKFEQAQLKKELTRLRRFFEGMSDLKKLPDVLIIVDPTREKIAVKEAALMAMPIVALVDTDGDPNLVDIAVPANDDAIKSVSFLVKQFGAAYLQGKNDK